MRGGAVHAVFWHCALPCLFCLLVSGTPYQEESLRKSWQRPSSFGQSVSVIEQTPLAPCKRLRLKR